MYVQSFACMLYSRAILYSGNSKELLSAIFSNHENAGFRIPKYGQSTAPLVFSQLSNHEDNVVLLDDKCDLAKDVNLQLQLFY